MLLPGSSGEKQMGTKMLDLFLTNWHWVLVLLIVGLIEELWDSWWTLIGSIIVMIVVAVNVWPSVINYMATWGFAKDNPLLLVGAAAIFVMIAVAGTFLGALAKKAKVS